MGRMIQIVSVVALVAIACIASNGEQKQTPLQTYNVSEDEVARFLIAFPKVKELLGKGTGDESALLMAIKKQPIKGLDEIARSNGFKDQADLLRVCGGSVAGYALLKLRESEAQFNQRLSSLTPEMKAMMKPQIGMIKQQLKKYESQVSEGTLAAVKKHYDAMDKLFAASGEK